MKQQFINRLRALFALVILAGFISPISAAPSDEISAAVLAGGASSVAGATPAQFTRAYSSVLVRVSAAKLPQYVTAGINLRPDLAGPITAATLRARRPQPGVDSCDSLNPILRAAVAAAPSAKEAIARAALDFAPDARECIIAATGASLGGDSQYASFRPPGVDAGNINSSAIGTINPGNIGAQANAQSGNQERVTICHNGNTLTLPRPAADAHLRNHSSDTVGPCPP